MADRIEGEDWKQVLFDEVVLEFLRAEHFKLKDMDDCKRHLIHSPDATRRDENMERRRMLAEIRGAIFQCVPPDTKWHLVRSVGNRHLNELLAMGGNCGWDDPKGVDKNELMRAAARCRHLPFVELDKWHWPVLWGHNTKGPFSILDGMHRFVGHVQRLMREVQIVEIDLNVPAYIGLSEQPCHWHFPDSPVGIYCVNPLFVFE